MDIVLSVYSGCVNIKNSCLAHTVLRSGALRFLLFVSVVIDWAMMLVCMTFNGGLFLAVVSGVATGQLLLQQTSNRGADCCSAGAHG